MSREAAGKRALPGSWKNGGRSGALSFTKGGNACVYYIDILLAWI